MSFSIYIGKLAAKAGAQADDIVRKVAVDLMVGVIEKSPVDTGVFKGNWQIGIGSVNSKVDKDDKDTTPLGYTDGKKEIEVNLTMSNFKSGKTIFISNSLPYARRLEDGYSTQSPPNAMVKLTVLNLKRNIRKALR